jgi:succinate dehydrogenase/fumarate reductase flavoprotein subunit
MSSEQTKVGRRSLLQGAAVGAGATALGILGGAGESADAAPKKWEERADVVVIGYGFAGTTAAITAHDTGVKVLLLEKAIESEKGGNSRVSANIFFWPDDVEKAKTYFRALTGPYMDNISDTMVDVWATEMHANRAWLEGMGLKAVEFGGAEFPELPGSDCVKEMMHGAGEIGQARLFDGVIEPAMAARKIRILYETPAVSLVKERGEIVGVIAERGGRRIAIKADRAVVLACGGFENNPTMVRSFIQGLARIYPEGTPHNTGDGIRMAMEVGAELWHMNNIAAPELNFKAPEFPFALQFNTPPAGAYLFVAADGKRFMGEGPSVTVSDRHGKINFHGLWMQAPAPVPIHIVFDETVRKARALGKGMDFGWDALHGNRYAWSDDNLREVEKGWIKKANTVRELAGLINLSPEALETTVSQFNRFAQDHNDADFNRKANTLAALQTPPYYAIELTPSFLNTQGGPRRNENAQVIGLNGKPIPRLFSAGELGSIYAHCYQGGGNVGECFAFGRIAGRNAARERLVTAG